MSERATPPPAPELRPSRRPEPTFNRSVQRTMVAELLLGGLLFVVLLGGAAYIGFIRPMIENSPAVVRPVLEAYMEAAALGDVVAAHRLYSLAALQTIRREDVAASFADRSLYEGFQQFQFTSFSRQPGGRGDHDVAQVEATLLYQSEAPATLKAELEQEEDTWRLRSITIERAAELPDAVP